MMLMYNNKVENHLAQGQNGSGKQGWLKIIIIVLTMTFCSSEF